ncbi:MAG: TldD/PmbA family protein [Bacteroidales bacterium]|nr:TldD/PmbA family protein [Bacteroidales bacterium]
MKLTQEEITIARRCMDFALENGAEKVRITLSKSLMDLTGVLNGEIDKTSRALDRSLQIAIFANGRFGTFSSNRLEMEGLRKFILDAISTVKMLEEDSFRNLPSPERLAKDAVTGEELKLYDPQYEKLDSSWRRSFALGTSAWSRKGQFEKGFRVIAEEGEYSDSVFDSLTIDSQGLYARHTETSFEIGYELTIEDTGGNRYSSYWWDAAPLLKDLDAGSCAETAALRAAAQIGPQGCSSGKYTVVVDTECASRLLTPVFNALGGYALQQKNSFLEGTIGKKVFPEFLDILDCPRDKGKTGSRLFDSEGVATKETPIIEKGVVKQYFLNTYIAAKMSMEPTVEDVTRAVVRPVGTIETAEQLLESVKDCIYVTGFNGGNSNTSTGNYSYGIEGFLVKGGKIVCPLREMLMTGNFITLWNSLFATARDARPCMSKLIPTLAFSNVDISA